MQVAPSLIFNRKSSLPNQSPTSTELTDNFRCFTHTLQSNAGTVRQSFSAISFTSYTRTNYSLSPCHQTLYRSINWQLHLINYWLILTIYITMSDCSQASTARAYSVASFVLCCILLEEWLGILSLEKQFVPPEFSFYKLPRFFLYTLPYIFFNYILSQFFYGKYVIVFVPWAYTGCPRRNGQNFGRVFLMLNYTDITQNTYIQSWTVTEIMAREVWNFDSCYTLIDYQIHIKTDRNMWFL